MMDTIPMDYNYNYNYSSNLNRGGDYNYNNNYSEPHRGGGFSSWSSENVHHPDSNFHRPAPSRRRPFPHGPPQDCGEDGFGIVKLYVAGIPKTCTEEEIRSIFEVHGNIVEIAILKEKTGQQRECCFIKYATLEEADRAIGALNNIYSFPGATLPIKVRYAQGERERLVNIAKPVPRLYVNYINKQATKRDIGEIFSVYGDVEDIHILCDEFKQSRGCGFVQYARSDMAIAAIDALNGTFDMGCEQPLLVRFAHPKKARFGDSRGNSKFGDTGVGPHFQEQIVRPVPYLNNSVAEKVSSGSHQVNPKPTASSSQAQSPQVGSKLDAISTIPTALEPEVPLECDWSEHFCPDGYSYYYNCETCESRWEKPQEYALFEQQLQKQHELKKQQEQQSSGSCKESHSPSTPHVSSMEEVPQMQQMKS